MILGAWFKVPLVLVSIKSPNPNVCYEWKKILELKIPPLAILLVFGILMWFCKNAFPFLSVNIYFKFVVAVVLAAFGCSIVIACIRAFYRAGTTVNPLKPETTTVLLMEGTYRYSRHPIYLGLALILLSWGIYLSNLLSLLLVIVFVIYINRFQIQPEERLLQKLFGIRFDKYKQLVRRWL